MSIQGTNSNSYSNAAPAFNGPLQMNVYPPAQPQQTNMGSELGQLEEELQQLDSVLLSEEGQGGSGSFDQSSFAQSLKQFLQSMSGQSTGSGNTSGNGGGSTGVSGTSVGGTTGSTGNSATSPNQGVTLTGGSTAPGKASGLSHMTNATTYSNLQDSTNWTLHNGNDDIGGSEKNGTVSVTPGDAANGGVEHYDSTFKGGYADTLASVTTKVSPDATKFLMTSTLDPSASTFKNTQCMENDMVITDKNGNQAQAASQFNLAEKAKPGYCWFQTSKMVSPGKEEWVNAAEVPIPKAGQDNTFQLGVTMGDGGKTYTYSPLVYDGKTYDLQNNTFSTEKSNWTKNECIIQQQEDSNKSGGPIDETYSNVSLQVGGSSSSIIPG